MEKELNIAAILKGMPENTRLWSPIFGDVYLKGLDDDFYDNKIHITHHGVDNIFMNNGKVWADGDVCLFPSKQMQDWSKFAWKKGDILAKDSTCVCVFNEWNNDKYTSIKCKYIKYMDAGSYAEDKVYITDNLHLASQEEKDAYISSIEEHYGGKLNLETLEIEHPKQEFKDGDIITIEDTEYKAIIIYKSDGGFMFRSYAIIDNACKKLGIDKIVNALGRCTRLAADSEKQQLFDALAKKNKRWNPDTKQIEDLPKKCEFKVFGKVLVRDKYNDEWMAGFFSHYIESSKDFVCTSGSWKQCIPYNEETAHLLGTTDEWKGMRNDRRKESTQGGNFEC